MSATRAKTWPEMYPAERQIVDWDYSDELNPGETVDSATLAVVLRDGTDPSPAALLDGALILATPKVYQWVRHPVAGCNYVLWCLATTSAGRDIAAVGILPVRAIA